MIKYILLGAVQGMTEFFPVSSSAHLVIFQKLFGIDGRGLVFPIVLHLGTLSATVLYFRRDILRTLSDRRQLLLVAAATLVTGVIAYLLKSFAEKIFFSPVPAAFTLLATGTALILTGRLRVSGKKDISLGDAALMGAAQGIAVLPGISRSGATISALLFRGIERETCFKFSFISGIPVVAGAALLDAREITAVCVESWREPLAGFLASFIFGLAALALLRRLILRSKLPYFGYYCLLAAAVILIFLR